MGGCGERLTDPKQPALDCILCQFCHLRQLSYRKTLDLFRDKQPAAAFRDICQQLVYEVSLHGLVGTRCRRINGRNGVPCWQRPVIQQVGCASPHFF